MKIYLAGPLFTAAEREFNWKLRDLLLDLGFEVWLPQDNEPRDKTADTIFFKDLEGIDWADVVVANMDGPDPDSGTAYECCYGRDHGKKVFTYRTDFRNGQEGGGFPPFNLMMGASASSTRIQLPMFSTTEEVAFAIGKAVNEIA